MTGPTVTVLMPVRNVEPACLDEVIASIANQTHPGWRLLIIAEPDDVDALSQRLTRSLDDDRVGICANQGRGLAGAFNTGMRRATTPFVAILLGDDSWRHDAVEVLSKNIAQHPAVDFFHSSRLIVDDDGAPISSVHLSRSECGVSDFFDSSPAKHLLCWRRSRGLAIGGMDESVNSAGTDDYDFPWSMAEHGAIFHAIPECLYFYRDHRRGVRLTTHVPLSTQLLELRRIFKKHGATRGQIFRKLMNARRTYLRHCTPRAFTGGSTSGWAGPRRSRGATRIADATAAARRNRVLRPR